MLNSENTANKRRLHDFTSKEHLSQPVYTSEAIYGWKSTVQSECLGVDQLRKLTIQVDGTTWGEGSGKSKREAQDAAAKQALITLNVSFVLNVSHHC